MNTLQRLALIAIGVGAVLMCLYPPFYFQYPNGALVNGGYTFLFDPPERGSMIALVQAPTLIGQLLGLAVVGSSAWLLAGKRQMKERESSSIGTRRINWKRGLFRLWLIASALWIVGVGGTAALNAADPAIVSLILVAPLVVLALGLAIGWISAGFREAA